MSNNFNSTNYPNPSKLIDSLRHLGYDNYVAISDIVDNSLDADSNKIKIKIWSDKGDFKLVIADNGSGMDHYTLDEALKLGSLTEKDPLTDLGKFGMGLVTAGLSLCKRTTVITKQKTVYYTSITDVDVVKERNEFCKYLEESTKEEIELFDSYSPETDSGTLILFEKCDGIKNTNTTPFGNTLKKHLGRVHRYFIRAGKEIYINDDRIEIVDPLELDNSKTEIFSDEEYPITIKSEDGQTIEERIRVRIVLIPEKIVAGKREMEASITHQGFYVLRNNREIKKAQTLDAFTKHNDFNRMRAELFFSGDLDEIVGIDFTKRDTVFGQSLHDQLLQHLKAQCTTIKTRESSNVHVKETAEVTGFHKLAEKYIDQKSKLLIMPKTEIEKRKTRDGTYDRRPTHKDPDGIRRPRKKQIGDAQRCKFLAAKMGPSGPIYECELVGRAIVIRWNIEHPFYERFILDQRSDGKLVSAVDYLVYSMASAELTTINDDNIDFIYGYKSIIASNVRTLLS